MEPKMKLFTVDFDTDEGIYNGVVIAEGESDAIRIWKEWAQKTYFDKNESIEDLIDENDLPEATEWVIDVPGPARALNWTSWSPFEGEYH
jgi:hypothetical protein